MRSLSREARGTILAEARRGYLLHGRLLRPAQVTVVAATSGDGGGEPPAGSGSSPNGVEARLLRGPRRSRESGPDDLKKAFRQLALQYHPDRNPGDKSAEERFKEINEAYSVLSDPDKRQQYDRFGHAGPGGRASAASVIFRDSASRTSSTTSSAGCSGAEAGRVRRGADLRYDLTVTFEEAVFGAEKEIVIPRTGSCRECSGTGARRVPGRNDAAPATGRARSPCSRGSSRSGGRAADAGARARSSRIRAEAARAPGTSGKAVRSR